MAINPIALRDVLMRLLKSPDPLADIGGNAPRGAAAGTPAPAISRDDVSMSDSVRALIAVLDRMAASPTAAATPAKPVLPAPSSDTAAFAESLKTAFTQSGVFYEAHLAQWAAGERSLEELMKEPQAALKHAEEPVRAETVSIVKQQLEALDTRQLVWQGQVWPGQQLEWCVEQDAQRESAPGDADPVWRTSLRLVMPRLGDVSATISLHGKDVRIAFGDVAAETRSAMRDHQLALRDAFGNAGLALQELKVAHDEA